MQSLLMLEKRENAKGETLHPGMKKDTMCTVRKVFIHPELFFIMIMPAYIFSIKKGVKTCTFE
jgi:hypothetical protein